MTNDDLDEEGPGEHDRHLTHDGKCCPDCGQEAFIDDDACRSCGHFFLDDLPEPVTKTKKYITLGVLFLIAFPVLYRLWKIYG